MDCVHAYIYIHSYSALNLPSPGKILSAHLGYFFICRKGLSTLYLLARLILLSQCLKFQIARFTGCFLEVPFQNTDAN